MIGGITRKQWEVLYDVVDELIKLGVKQADADRAIMAVWRPKMSKKALLSAVTEFLEQAK